MGITLEDVLNEFKSLKDSVDYYLNCKGYTATDIENMLGDLEQKLREVEEHEG